MIAETINQISNFLDAATNFIPKVIAFASVTSAFLPKPDGTGFLSKAHKAINAVAFNFNEAENKK
jgi:hypothetical protein